MSTVSDLESSWTTRWSVITVATAGFLLVSMGGAIFASPVTLPLLYRVARTNPRRGLRITAAVVGGLTLTQAAWFAAYLALDEAQPWIWLVPTLTAAAWTSYFLVLVRRRPVPVR